MLGGEQVADDWPGTNRSAMLQMRGTLAIRFGKGHAVTTAFIHAMNCHGNHGVWTYDGEPLAEQERMHSIGQTHLMTFDRAIGAFLDEAETAAN